MTEQITPPAADAGHVETTTDKTPETTDQTTAHSKPLERLQKANDAHIAEKEELRKKLEEFQKKEKELAEAKLLEEKNYQELLDQRKKEIEELTNKANAAEKVAQEILATQEEELKGLLEEIPEEHRLIIDNNSSVTVRLKQARHILSMVKSVKPASGGSLREEKPNSANRLEELSAKSYLTADEAFEKMGLGK